MSCGLEKDRLSGYYDGELDAGERAEVERHIASCSECLRELGELKASATDLKSLARVAAPASVRAEIARQTAAGAPRFQRWFQAAVAAAAVALFAVSLVIIARQGRSEDTVATLNPPAREAARALKPEAGETEQAGAKWQALKQDKHAEEKKAPGLRDDARNEEALRDLKEEPPGKKEEPKPAEPAPAPPNAPPAADPAPAYEELRKKSEDFAGGFAEDAEREAMRRGAAPSPAVPTVLSVAAADLASMRAETEALFKALGVKPVVGAAELGNTSHVKDHYTTVELTEAEFEALQKHLAKAKAKVASTTLAAEKASLAKLSRARGEFTLGGANPEGAKKGGATKAAPAPGAAEGGGADRGKTDDKSGDGAVGQGGGAGGRTAGGKETKEGKDAKKDPAAETGKPDAATAEGQKPAAKGEAEKELGDRAADAEESKTGEEAQKAKLLDKAVRRRFIIHWVEPPAAAATDK